MSKLLQQSREEVKCNAENILHYNRSNNKDTYKFFNLWNESDKKFVLDLMSLLGYFEYKHGIPYYEKIVRLFYLINDKVAECRYSMEDDSMRLKYYELATMEVLREEWFGDILERKKIVKRYKQYRGMAKWRAYRWTLDNESLKERTIQMMMERDFSDYLQTEGQKEHWLYLQQKFTRSELIWVLQA